MEELETASEDSASEENEETSHLMKKSEPTKSDKDEAESVSEPRGENGQLHDLCDSGIESISNGENHRT